MTRRLSTSRPRPWHLLPFLLVMQLWTLGNCCMAGSGLASADDMTPWAPGGVLVICSGDGMKTIAAPDTQGGTQDSAQDHGDLCAMAMLGLAALVGSLASYALPGASATYRDGPAPARAPPAAYRSRAPPLFV